MHTMNLRIYKPDDDGERRSDLKYSHMDRVGRLIRGEKSSLDGDITHVFVRASDTQRERERERGRLPRTLSFS